MTETLKVAQREAYGKALVELGKENQSVVVLDADVAKSTRTVYFAENFPERYFDFGIAEQNMMGAAAGMAKFGLIPFVNSFSFLTTYRAAEQFRTSVVYPNLNVKVVAHYAGLSDSFDGPTHQTVADIAWVRALPNLCVVVPSDAIEVEKALPVLAAYNGPVWLRLSRNPTQVITPADYRFILGKAVVLREGSDITLIGCGVILPRILKAAQALAAEGINPLVIAMPTLKPLDEETIIKAARKTGAIITCEEHNIIGGLGSAVSETVTSNYPVPVKRLGIPDVFAQSGDYDQLLDKYGLAEADIFKAAVELFKFKRK